MEALLDRLQDSLQKLMGLHRQLLDTVRMEREALAQAELKHVEEAVYAKQAIIEAVRRAEHERLGVIEALEANWARKLADGEKLSLSSIVIDIQVKFPERAEALRSSFNALTLLIKRISEQNRDNLSFVERSLANVGQMKRNVLGESAAPRNDTYTATGQKATNGGSSRLISREI